MCVSVLVMANMIAGALWVDGLGYVFVGGDATLDKGMKPAPRSIGILF